MSPCKETIVPAATPSQPSPQPGAYHAQPAAYAAKGQEPPPPYPGQPNEMKPVFFSGPLGGEFLLQTITHFVCFWMFFTFSLSTKAIPPPTPKLHF